MEATVVAADDRSGVAVLKTDCVSPFLPIGDSSDIKKGTPVVSIGYPQEFDATASLGMIADREKHHRGRYFSTSHFRANLAVHCGQGGSPVLGFDGKVVGIVMSQIGGGASCFVLPIEAAEKVRRDTARFGELRPGWVGVEVEDTEAPIMGSTARIAKIVSADSGSRHGLREGDTLLRIGGRNVETCEDILDASFFLTAGDPTDIDVVRDGAPLTLTVKPMLHPAAIGGELHAGPKADGIPALD
jgi:serine protease Do